MVVLAVLALGGLIAAVVLCFEVGYRLGRCRWIRFPESAQATSTTIEASVFGLLGLLIAFTFYGAGARFDVRRNLIGQEANAIGTAYLRIDLLPPEAQPQIRNEFRAYLRSRLAVYEKLPDINAAKSELARSATLQQKIWQNAVEATKTIGAAGQSLVLASINEMIDITTTRTVALLTHPPLVVFLMLAFAVITSSALAGYTMSISAVRDWTFIIAFALTIGSALYVILDYEFPRIGLVRVDTMDQVLVQTLENMK